MILAAEPLIEWGWVASHQAEIASRLGEHLMLTGIAVGVGLLISFPIGVACFKVKKLYPPVTWITGLLYTIPSLALFAFLVPFTGLTTLTAEIGLVSYTLLILIRNIVEGLNSVPSDTREAAKGMGLSQRQILWKVEIPLALPVILAGVRIATVTTIGLVTVTALIGKGGLGYFILQGLRRFFSTPIFIGALLSVSLAMGADGFLLLVQRMFTPWSRRRAAS